MMLRKRSTKLPEAQMAYGAAKPHVDPLPPRLPQFRQRCPLSAPSTMSTLSRVLLVLISYPARYNFFVKQIVMVKVGKHQKNHYIAIEKQLENVQIVRFSRDSSIKKTSSLVAFDSLAISFASRMLYLLLTQL
ncbi:hypothetical protein PMAYCL1PPCAC_10197, partial [Pristionchus mayeri]